MTSAADCMSYRDAMAELVGRAKSGELPEPVVRALAGLFESPQKLFAWNPDPALAGLVGTPNIDAGLQASNLLIKLIQAVRALDWEVVIVTCEQHGSGPRRVCRRNNF